MEVARRVSFGLGDLGGPSPIHTFINNKQMANVQHKLPNVFPLYAFNSAMCTTKCRHAAGYAEGIATNILLYFRLPSIV